MGKRGRKGRRGGGKNRVREEGKEGKASKKKGKQQGKKTKMEVTTVERKAAVGKSEAREQAGFVKKPFFFILHLKDRNGLFSSRSPGPVGR